MAAYTSGTTHMHQHQVTPKGSEGEQVGTCDHSHCSHRFTCACSPLWTLSTSPCSLIHAVSCARRFELHTLPVFHSTDLSHRRTKNGQHNGTSVLWRKPWRTHLESSVVMGSSLLDCPAAQTRYTVSTMVAAAAAVRCYRFSHTPRRKPRGVTPRYQFADILGDSKRGREGLRMG